MNIKLRTEPTALAAFAREIQATNARLLSPSPLSTSFQEVNSMDAVMLRARSRRWLRKLLVITWSAYLLTSPWWTPNSKLVACLISVIVLGTYRETYISKVSVAWSFCLAFLPVGTWTSSLQGAHCLQSEWEEQGGMIEALMLGLWGLVLAPLIDWLCPWRGGVFQLWIKAENGRKILIWRGRSERAFHSNHRLVQSVTQLPTPRDLKQF